MNSSATLSFNPATIQAFHYWGTPGHLNAAAGISQKGAAQQYLLENLEKRMAQQGDPCSRRYQQPQPPAEWALFAKSSSSSSVAVPSITISSIEDCSAAQDFRQRMDSMGSTGSSYRGSGSPQSQASTPGSTAYPGGFHQPSSDRESPASIRDFSPSPLPSFNHQQMSTTSRSFPQKEGPILVANNYNNTRQKDRTENISINDLLTKSLKRTFPLNAAGFYASETLSEPVDLSCKRLRLESAPAALNAVKANKSKLFSILSEPRSNSFSYFKSDRVASDPTPRAPSHLGGGSSLREDAKYRQDQQTANHRATSTGGGLGLSKLEMALRLKVSLNCSSDSASSSSSKSSQTVTLAKKTALPIRARVSDWFLKAIRSAKAQEEFQSLPCEQRLALLINSWSKLILLYMAENNFAFAVTPVHVVARENDDARVVGTTEAAPGGGQKGENSSAKPNMRSVETIQNFIRKCQALNLDSEEYRLLRLATLFSPGHNTSSIPIADACIEAVNCRIRQELKDHVHRSHPAENIRYCSILLCLHSLFGINCEAFQKLFCEDLTRDSGVEALLGSLLSSAL